ncbi:hypothetical protein [Rhodococcus kronopolitis]|uniref:Uncharacterized protein n=1 Tax=Rhodococcus kronopolitis TaxID=1460226 RepID=A0ABV9FUD3_9NOCA
MTTISVPSAQDGANTESSNLTTPEIKRRIALMFGDPVEVS